MEVEKIYGDAMVRFAYNTKLGSLFGGIIASRGLSKLYGKLQDTNLSGDKVPKFVENFKINMDEFRAGSKKSQSINNSYRSFNEFFIREFKDGMRNFCDDSSKLAACAEARYFGHEKVSDELQVPVKGSFLNALDLLGNKKLAEKFVGGPFIIARLCPVDYHRYHYPDSGKTKESYTIKGDFHSVNPIALKLRQDILIKNERRVALLETENFGDLAFVEVGATCVGKIIQSFDESSNFKRGDEKGYFLFGGSTVIIYGEPGKWKPSQDILKNTQLGFETYIKLGDEIATKLEG